MDNSMIQSISENLSIINLEQFTWLRPQALWLLVLLVPILILSWRKLSHQGQWQQAIDPHLLNFLLRQGERSRSWRSLILLSIAYSLAVLALAGPSFQKQPVPVYRTGEARVVLLDLSLSMDAVDIKPSRLTRAKHKLRDILDASKEGETALVVYAGDAFVISPLTSDANTIANMVPVLSTSLMPILGSEPKLAIAKAVELLKNAGKLTGKIIWITDGIDELDVEPIIEQLQETDYELSLLLVATEQGAPIPLPQNQGFLKDSNGEIVMPALHMKPLQKLASRYPAQLIRMTPDNRDIELLMGSPKTDINQQDLDQEQKSVSDQLDQGYLLLLPLLPLLLFLFRKKARIPGITLALCLVVLAPKSYADVWDDLWWTKDQQGQKALNKNQPDVAAELFENPQWKASAHYRAGHYQQAEQGFALGKSAVDHYNRGNALAFQKKYDEAIAAYEEALKLAPDFEDAQYNKMLSEQLKQQQEQQQQNNQNQDQQQNDQQQDQQNQDQQSENQDQQDQQQNDQQQEQEQQEQEQQKSEQQEQQQMELQDQRDEQEKDQALEQWLRKIPDDPGGLLRRKMYREYKKRGRENRFTKEIW
jgi:Ca-activated chloride channel family protein